MASFFYADIKTDELQVHGHNPSIPAQIELFDASASNIITLKAPAILSQPAVSITLPSSVSNTNSLMMNTGGTGVLELITPSGDLTMANYGTFTLNSISNTSTVTSAANISLANGKQLNLGNAANIGYDANTNIILSGSNQVIAKLGEQQVFSATYIGGNALINMGSISGETGIGFKNTSGGQIQVKPNLASSWTNLVTHLGNLGDVTVTTPANTNALLYNSGTNKWVNRQILYSDIGSKANITVDSINFTNSNILIGQTTVTNNLNKVIILNTSSAITPTVNGGFYVDFNVVTLGGGNGFRLVYNDTTGQVNKQANTMIALTDVDNAVDTIDGGCLRYISSSATYASRGTQYYSYAAYGQLNSYASAIQKGIFLSSTWASRTEDTIYAYPAGKFLYSSITGAIDGFDITKTYKIEFHISQNGNNISTNMTWQARILATSNVGTVLRAVRIGQVTDDRAPSLHCVAIVSGYAAYYLDYGLTAGSYSTTVSPDCQISICCHEM